MGEANRIESDGVYNYTYDDEGNTTKKVRISDGQTWTYGYDQRNMMVFAEQRVTDGGTLSGRITLSGAVPKPKGYNLTTLPDAVYCGRISDGRGWRLLQPFNVGEKGAFRDIVVFIEGIEKGKSFAAFKMPRVEAIDCRFLPFITVVRDQQPVMVVNMDPAMQGGSWLRKCARARLLQLQCRQKCGQPPASERAQTLAPNHRGVALHVAVSLLAQQSITLQA